MFSVNLMFLYVPATLVVSDQVGLFPLVVRSLCGANIFSHILGTLISVLLLWCQPDILTTALLLTTLATLSRFRLGFRLLALFFVVLGFLLPLLLFRFYRILERDLVGAPVGAGLKIIPNAAPKTVPASPIPLPATSTAACSVSCTIKT